MKPHVKGRIHQLLTLELNNLSELKLFLSPLIRIWSVDWLRILPLKRYQILISFICKNNWIQDLKISKTTLMLMDEKVRVKLDNCTSRCIGHAQIVSLDSRNTVELIFSDSFQRFIFFNVEQRSRHWWKCVRAEILMEKAVFLVAFQAENVVIINFVNYFCRKISVI